MLNCLRCSAQLFLRPLVATASCQAMQLHQRCFTIAASAVATAVGHGSSLRGYVRLLGCDWNSSCFQSLCREQPAPSLALRSAVVARSPMLRRVQEMLVVVAAHPLCSLVVVLLLVPR
jgi:hypothetical protein